jgi:hypothetical protein
MDQLRSMNPEKPLIALDYDQTCTLNIPFWAKFIDDALLAGFQVLIVTMRYQWECDDIDPRISNRCDILPTARQAKKEYCEAAGIYPAIWIDDSPHFIFLDAQGAARPALEKSPLLPDYGSDIAEIVLARDKHNI